MVIILNRIVSEALNRGIKLYQSYANDGAKQNEALRKARITASAAYKVFRAVFLTSLGFVLLYPLLIMSSIAFRDPSQLFDPTVVWIPKSFTLMNFVRAFEGMDYVNVASLTGIIAVISTFCQLLCCTLAGYSFARFKFKGKNVLFILLTLTIIVPPQVFIIPSYIDFINFDFFGLGSLAGLFTGTPVTVNLIDSLFAYFLPALFGAGIKSGLFIFIFNQFFRGLPRELEDAAYIDGCSRIRTFAVIMLPNATGAILTVTLFSLVWYWNDYFYNSFYFNDLNVVSRTLLNIQVALGNNEQNPYDLIPQIQSAALLSILPLLCIYTVLQKYFTESIERTGIVG